MSVFIPVFIIVLIHNLILLFHVFFAPRSLTARRTRTVIVTILVPLVFVLSMGWVRHTDMNVNSLEFMLVCVYFPIVVIVVSSFVWAITQAVFRMSQHNAKLAAFFLISFAPLLAGAIPSLEKKQERWTKHELAKGHYTGESQYQSEYISRVRNSELRLLAYGAGTTLAYVAIGFVALGIVRMFPKKGQNVPGPIREVGKTHGDTFCQ